MIFRPLSDNTHKGPTSMPPAGFEPAIPKSERPQTHALDRAAKECSASTDTQWRVSIQFIEDGLIF